MARVAKRKKKPSNTAHGPISRAPRRVKSLQKFLRAYGEGENGREARKAFARRVGSSLPYLEHLGYGYRIASVELSALIEKHTHGLVRCEDMRPDIDWVYFSARKSSPLNAQAR